MRIYDDKERTLFANADDIDTAIEIAASMLEHYSEVEITDSERKVSIIKDTCAEVNEESVFVTLHTHKVREYANDVLVLEEKHIFDEYTLFFDLSSEYAKSAFLARLTALNLVDLLDCESCLSFRFVEHE